MFCIHLGALGEEAGEVMSKLQGGAWSNRIGNYWGQISTDQSNELSSKLVEDVSWQNEERFRT